MEPRKPKPQPAQPSQVEGGLIDPKAPAPQPARPGGMIGEGAPDPGEGAREGGMIGEG